MEATPAPGLAKPTLAEAVAMTLLGIDWGARRIGIAVKPAGRDWALPRGIIEYRSESEAIDALIKAADETEATGIVVGLPLHGDMETAKAVRKFCRKARAKISGRRWFFTDETLTSQGAEGINTGGSRRRSDDLAAKLILETFLQTCRDGR